MAAAAAAAAAKSLQLCPTLCDPIDGSPPGSPVPGILQARTLEWVAISFSNAWKWQVKVKLLSHVWPLATPWTAAYQTPPTMGVSRQEHWSGLPFPSSFMAAVTMKFCSDFGAQESNSITVSVVSPSICCEVMGRDAMILFFWTLSFKPAISLSSSTFIQRLFSSSLLSAIRVVSSAYLKLLIFLPAILIPALHYFLYRKQYPIQGLVPVGVCTCEESLSSLPCNSRATCSVTKSFATLCDPMDYSTPGSSALFYLLEFAQIHVHWVPDTIGPSDPLLHPSPFAFNLSQHQDLFQWVGSLYQVAKVLELQLQHQSFQWIFRVDFI